MRIWQEAGKKSSQWAAELETIPIPQRSSEGALWTPAYTPGWRSDQSGVLQQHWTVHVQCLYISCYVTVNKPVLSYLLGKLLPPFSAQVRSNFETFNWSPEGWGQNVGVDHFRTGGIPKCKTSPCGGGAPPTSCPKCWTFFSHWRLRYPYRRGHAIKISQYQPNTYH